MTRKFMLQQKWNASSLSSDREQLTVEGRGYKAVSPTATLSRPRVDSRKSYSGTERSPVSRTPSVPLSTCSGRVTVARTPAWIYGSRPHLGLQLAQSIIIEPLQLRHSRTSQFNSHELHDSTRTDSTVTNSSHHPTDGRLFQSLYLPIST